MGLFSHKPKGNNCTAFLAKVDKVYVGALSSRNARMLEPYFTRKCLVRVVERVHQSNYDLGGLERYRHVNYKLQSQDGATETYLKEITFENVSMGYGVVVPVGDAVRELWSVEKQESGLLVSSIAEV